MADHPEEYSRDLPHSTVWIKSALTVLVIGPWGLLAVMGSINIFLMAWPVSLSALWMAACASKALWEKKPVWHVQIGLAAAFVLLPYWLVQGLPGLLEPSAKNDAFAGHRRFLMLYMGLSGWLLVLSLMIRHRLGWRHRMQARA